MNPLDFLTPWQDMPDSFSADPTSGEPSFGANTPSAAGDAGLLPVAQAAASPFPALGDPLAGTSPQDRAPAPRAFLPWEGPELAPVEPVIAGTTGLDGVRQWYLNGFGSENPSGASFASAGFGPDPNVLAPAPAGAAQAGNPLDLALTPTWAPPASPASSIGGPGFQAPEAPKTWLLAHALNNAYGFAPPPAQTAFVKEDWSQPARVDPGTATATGLDDIRQWDLTGFGGQTPSGASFAAPRFGRTSADAAQAGNPLDLALTPAWAPPPSPFPAAGAAGFQAPEAPKTWLLAHALNNAYGFAPPPAMPQTPSARTGLVEGSGPEPARVGAVITGPDEGQQGQVNGFGRQSPSDVPWNGSGFRPAPNPLTPASASIVRIVPPRDSAISRPWTAPGAPFSPTGASGVQAPQTPKTWLLAHALNNAYGFAPTPATRQTPPATWESADDDTQDGSEQSAAPQDQGFMSQVMERGKRGLDQTTRNLEVAAIVAGQGFTPEGKDRLASIVMANDREARKAQARLDPEEQAIHEQLYAVGKSEGVVGTLKAIGNLAPTAVTNPKGLALGLAEQAANSAPTLIGSATGWATGLAVGGAAGTAIPVIGNATGGAVGSFLGARAGAAAGTAILEFGNEIQEYMTNRLEKEKKPLTRENIIALLSDPAAQEAMVRQAAIKGVTLAAVEAFFPGFSGRMAASTKGVVRAGIKVASDPVGGMVAEGTSSGLARGEVDKAAIAGEGIFGATHQAGHGMVHHAAGAATHTASTASTSDPHTPPTAPDTPATERNASSDGTVRKAPTDNPASTPSTDAQTARPVTRGKPVLTAPGNKPFRSEGEARSALRRAGILEGGYNFERVKYGIFAVPKGRFLTSAEFSNLPSSGTINPYRIRFSQNNVKSEFKNSNGLISELAENLKNSTIDSMSIAPIRIVIKNGMIYTLDNRRLYAFQLAGVEIPYKKINDVPKTEFDKFSTRNNGHSAYIRKGNKP